MQDRFKFNAVVSSYYDIDTPDKYEEFEPKFYLKDVDLFRTGEIGVDYDVLFDVVKEQTKNLTEKEIGQIMQHFEDNSNSPECDYVTIRPDKIIQCTGLKDENGKLIYEGDILRYPPKEQYDEKNYVACEVFFHNNDCCDNHIGFQMNRYRFQGALCGIVNFGTKYKFIPKNTEKMEIIGNIYENAELLEG